MKNLKQPAFPTFDGNGHYVGLTKLEYFAAIAMQGLCVSDFVNGNYNETEIAEFAVRQAKELLKQLEK